MDPISAARVCDAYVDRQWEEYCEAQQRIQAVRELTQAVEWCIRRVTSGCPIEKAVEEWYDRQ